MRLLIVAALVAFAVPASGETKLGAGVRIEHATAIPTLAAAPQDYVGKTIRVDGVATAVCTAMGCWMAVRAESDPKGPVLRLKVEDGAIVFPLSAKGKKVSAEGVFEAIGGGDEHGKRLRPERGAKTPSESERGWGAASIDREAAGEHARQDARASAQYQIKATGAVIR